MGDDLKVAGEFIISAMTQMDVLLTELRLDAERALPIVTTLSASAKAAHARGIFRAAQRVIESYENGYSQPKIDGRLMSLYKLVVQYHAGWEEIAPGQQAQAQIQQAPAAPITVSPTADDYAAAKATLTALMPFAGQEQARLSALMGISHALPPAQERPMQTPLTQERAAQQTAFETIMPDLINEALRFARLQGKSVSLSYAAEGLQLCTVELAAAYIRLEEIVTDFISRKIATPSQRAQQGLTRGGHIDISVMDPSAQTKLSITCEGESKEIELCKSSAPYPQSAHGFDPYMELGT